MSAALRRNSDVSVQLAAAALILLFAITGGWVVLFATERGLLASMGNIGVQGAYVGALGLSVAALLRSGLHYREVMPPASLCLTLGWCWLSTTWAIHMGFSVTRISLTTMILVTIFVSTGILGYDRSMRIFRGYLIISLVAAYVWVFAFPASGIQIPKEFFDAPEPSWRGIFLESLERRLQPHGSRVVFIEYRGWESDRDNVLRRKLERIGTITKEISIPGVTVIEYNIKPPGVSG